MFTAVLVLLFAILAYLFVFLPRIGRLVPGGDLDVTGFRQRVAETQAYMAQLTVADEAFKQVNAERKTRVTNAVPLQADAPGLYVTLDTIAAAHGMQLTAIDVTPDDKVISPTGSRAVNITANVNGATYQQFKLFLSDLERSERLLDLRSVVFTPGSGQYDLAIRGYWIDAEQSLTPVVEEAAILVPIAK